jgi:hypothetical protein
MEADWEFEVGGDAPIIEACWAGFVDLREAPARAWELMEVREAPALAAALETLNSSRSTVWTSKCDFWPALGPEEFDAWELDAPIGDTVYALGCYIDILPRESSQWSRPPVAEEICKRLCGLLGAVPLPCCRVDLVVRRAVTEPDAVELGISAYITACGPTHSEAAQTFEAALRAFAHALLRDSTVQ